MLENALYSVQNKQEPHKSNQISKSKQLIRSAWLLNRGYSVFSKIQILLHCSSQPLDTVTTHLYAGQENLECIDCNYACLPVYL